MKKVLAIALALCMILALCAITASAESVSPCRRKTFSVGTRTAKT